MNTEFTKMVQSARDHALLGAYTEALSLFQQAIQSVANLNEYRPAVQAIQEEYAVVQTLLATFNRISLNSGQPCKKPLVPASKQAPAGAFQISIENPNFKGTVDGGLGKHSAAPFSHHREADPFEYVDTNTCPPLPRSPALAKPPARIKTPTLPKSPARKPRQAPVQSYNPPLRQPMPRQQRPVHRPGIPKLPGQTRSHPAALPERVTPPQGSVSNEFDFLHSKYPDRTGPDAHLIEMLEREVIDRNPQVNFDDVAELQDAKRLLEEAVLLPMLMPDFFKGIRRPWKGVLMFGPPGTGKTMLAKAVASQGTTRFFNVSASSFASKWKGESEKLVRLLFEMARFYAPTVLFFDEIDAIGAKRGGSSENESSRRVKSEMLVQMDGAANQEENKRVIVLAATNRPWDLDEALRRRLEKRVYIPLPGAVARRRLFELNLKNTTLDPAVDWKFLVSHTKGYSGADILTVCRDAAMNPMRKKIAQVRGLSPQTIQQLRSEVDVPVTMADLKQALTSVSRSVSGDDLARFSQWMKEYGST